MDIPYVNGVQPWLLTSYIHWDELRQATKARLFGSSKLKCASSLEWRTSTRITVNLGDFESNVAANPGKSPGKSSAFCLEGHVAGFPFMLPAIT